MPKVNIWMLSNVSFIMLGSLYSITGLIGPIDNSKKEYWFSMSKNYYDYFIRNHEDSFLIYCSGYFFDFVLYDHKEAFKCYEISARQGNSLAQYNLGICYQDGEGIPKDLN